MVIILFLSKNTFSPSDGDNDEAKKCAGNHVATSCVSC